MVNLREYIYANTKLELNISYILKKVMSVPSPPPVFLLLFSVIFQVSWLDPTALEICGMHSGPFP